MKNRFDIIIIGGGAAGFFTAINISEKNPNLKVAILERGNDVLTKVKVSGGGRCNVTHAEFIPVDLSKNYPRGEKELLGPFHTFMTGDTIEWFEKKGVPLKIEEDGRMFPVSDSSQTIIDCFVKEVTRLGISLIKKTSVQNIIKENGWLLETNKGVFTSEKIVIASGSNPKIWNLLKKLGHTIIEPVPSLFTFNINDIRINDLPGIAKKATVSVLNQKNKKFIESQGDLLITHKGLSGPAILKLSAWNAIELNEINYTFKIKINWLLDLSYNDVVLQLRQMSTLNAKQTVYKYAQFELPKRLWQNLLLASSIQKDLKWAEISKLQIQELANQLTAGEYEVMGKSTFKEEFVTAGGVDLKEINFKKFNSKIHPDLYFAGEVLNIDAITGGFNFQNAWTGGFIVAKSI
ncbi:MAG: putative Rossmann fold flavoprotein [Flavobacteriaceae bacterium]|uniref:NAD(P)/FAD-dependent oxidoreductase n=1 Tax=Candidatus Marifrigoribacter sp. Uisw_064 TaxID=3230970 RepID=UPI003AE35832